MTCRLVPIETPIGMLTDRAAIAQRLRHAWPEQPATLHTMLTTILAHPMASSDALLIVADALTEASRAERVEGHLVASQRLDRLRTLFLEAAPDRADVPL